MANTKEQQWAIDAEGSNIIVSAGAGSGKTAVLTQRVIRKIMSGVDVSKLLVLTFTNFKFLITLNSPFFKFSFSSKNNKNPLV